MITLFTYHNKSRKLKNNAKMPSFEGFVRGPDNEIRGVEDFGSREFLSTVLNIINSFIKSNDMARSLWEQYKNFFKRRIDFESYIDPFEKYIIPFFYFFITIYLLGEDSEVALSLNKRLENGIEKLNNSINGIDSEDKAIEFAEGLVRSHINTDAAEFILGILRVWRDIFSSDEELHKELENLYT
jgi:hypothetical protein